MKTKLSLALFICILLSGCATFPRGRLHRCINNMRILDAATEQCAMDKKLSCGDIAARAELSKYIKNGIDSIHCPAGGTYTTGIVGDEPRCSKHGTLTEATTEAYNR